MKRGERRRWTPLAGAFGGRASRRSFWYEAFVPDEVAEIELRLAQDVANAVSEAERELQDLNVRGPQLEALEVLSRQLLRAEAVASSRIEGLQMSHRRIARADFDPQEGDAGAREVLGNLRAMEQAITLASARRPFTIDDVLTIHGTLFEGKDDARSYAGQIRQQQNWLGGHGDAPAAAEYIPPVPERVAGLLDDLCRTVNERDDMSPVVQAAIVHAQFETIHPFVDGNGRVGRCLIHVVLRRRGLAPNYVPPVSLVLVTDQRAYVRGLVTFRDYNDDAIASWIGLFAQAARSAATHAVALATDLASLEGRWRERAHLRRRGSAPERLITLLAASPVIDVPTAAERLGVEYETARLAVERLVAAGVLVGTSARKRDRIYEAPSVFELIDEFERRVAAPAGSPRPARPVAQERTRPRPSERPSPRR